MTQRQTTVLLCGGLILLMGIGIRASYGLFQAPLTAEMGWGREPFSFAMALQQIIWGALVPVSGALADRYGTARVLIGAAALYAIGQLLMAFGGNLFLFTAGASVFVGAGVAGLGFGPVLAAMARAFPAERRAFVLGIGTAAGSVGQMVMVPVGAGLLSAYGWSYALAAMTAFLLFVPLLTIPLRGKPPLDGGMQQSLTQALSEALGHRGFLMLGAGYFVCGFQVAFITVHMPAYLVDNGLPLQLGGYALALVGFFNIIGSLAAGWSGQYLRKKYVLAGIYISRSVVVTVFMLVPLTSTSVYIFSAFMGLLWLSTVPLTTATVAQIFGLRYMATLSGVVFFSHQFGSFLGVWLGGRLYDATGSYDIVWWGGVVLGVFAFAINLPVDDRPVARLAQARA